MKGKNITIKVAAAVLAIAAVAAHPLQVSNPGFDKVPHVALQKLRATLGKANEEGFVFVNGHFMPGPYTVIRYGTAIAINNVQVTGEIVPWSRFLTYPTGDGNDFGARGSVEADNIRPDQGLKKTREATGEFLPGGKTDALLRLVNDKRLAIDRALREGDFFFFGVKYSPVTGNNRIAKNLIDFLPEAMRDATSPNDLYLRLHSRGITFLNETICRELFAHRFDYLALQRAREEMKKRHEQQQILTSGAKRLAL